MDTAGLDLALKVFRGTDGVAVILLAGSEHVDAMISALEGHGARAVRNRLTPEAVPCVTG